MIYCFGKPEAVSRKVNPDFPFVEELEQIDAWDYKKPTGTERLDYNRRTGEFYVPGPGTVYLYDREDEKPQDGGIGGPPGQEPAARKGVAERGGTRPGTRTVTPTSAASPNRVAARTDRPLILMQVKFRDGMKGRVGAGQANDTRQERWSEFFGNIEFLRSAVKHEGVVLNPDDRLSPDGFYLTSQMLRIIQEPPRPGSLEKTSARNWAKAFDQVHVNRGEAFTIESDVATFDSDSDQLLAYGENGHRVSFAQQAVAGQPPSAGTARSVQYNVKTHAWSQVEGSNVMWVDHKTGVRPVPMSVPDPTAPPKPKFKQPFRVPNTNIERRGFTGY
jgi:hypothetical protein